jgi:hypothetical protein
MTGIYQCPRDVARSFLRKGRRSGATNARRGAAGSRADLSIVLARKAPTTTRSVGI